MDVKALQNRLRDFAAARDWQPFHAPKNLAMALMVEAAELLELFQWQTLTESRGFTRDPRNKERVADEVADVLLYLLQLADHADVDLEQAVETKLLKNSMKHPAKRGESAVPPRPQKSAVAAAAPPATVQKTHLLVDWENVQPSGEALQALVPEATDVWLFHGPHQKVDDSGHRQAYGGSVTLVPRSGAGRNALDFQLTYYVGYIAARQPEATFVVVSNDQGYDPMLEHACELGFKARRCGHGKLPVAQLVAPSITPVLPEVTPPALTQKAVAKETAQVSGSKATREDVQQLTRLIEGLAAAQRPTNKRDLLAMLQRHLGEPGADSPRLAHALSQLQALRQVTVKKDAVTYPAPALKTSPAPTKKEAAAVKKAISAKNPAPTKKPTPAKKSSPISKTASSKNAAPTPPKTVLASPTSAQVAQAVLASLKKMPKNRPTRRAGLLKLIKSHAHKAAEPQAMAELVCTLLEARKDVVASPGDQSITYPNLEEKRAATA